MLAQIAHSAASLVLSFYYDLRPMTYELRPTTHDLTTHTKVIIGRDTRSSGQQIEGILARNLSACGVNVLLAGIITTPGLSFLVKKMKADMGIMISASHNKASDNGLKFFNSKGYKLSWEEENKIEALVNPLSRQLTKTPAKKGNIRSIKTSSSEYVHFLNSTIKGLNLGGMRIALDCASGSASFFAKQIFKQLKARVYSINDIPSGENINGGGAIAPSLLRNLVLDTHSDMGIALDGDGDRGILVDEKGNILDGDFILAIMANYLIKKNKLAKNTIAATVMSNYGLRQALEEMGAKAILTQVGDKFVLKALIENKLNLGGEQSGHIIFLDYLPTPDGLLTALQMLKVMQETKSKLSELAKCITKFPQILVNVKVKEKRPFEEFPALNKRLQSFNTRLNGEGRILLRYSGTEPLARVMVEGRDRDLIEDIADSLANHIKDEIGI